MKRINIFICFFIFCSATAWAISTDNTPWSVTGLTITTPVAGSVNLNWIKSADDGAGDNDVEGYNVYRSSWYGNFTIIDSKIAGTTFYIDSSFTTATTYYYMVRSSDSVQDSGGLRFDGINDRITVPDSASLNTSTSITVEAWVFIIPIKSQSIVDQSNYGAKKGYSLAYDASRQFKWTIYENGNQRNQWRGFVSTGTWVHVVGTYDG